MKEFVEYLVRQLVDKPEEVHVSEIHGTKSVVFELRVGHGDMGKVIGRKGQHAKSLRTLLAAVAAKHNRRAVLEILDDPEPMTRASRTQDSTESDQENKPEPNSGIDTNIGDKKGNGTIKS